MASASSFQLMILVIQCLAALSVSHSTSVHFFLHAQVWAGSFCASEKGCCFPNTGMVSQEFTVHGLFPCSSSGTRLMNCDRGNSLDLSQITGLLHTMQRKWPSYSCPSSDSTPFWAHEWSKHGTCSLSVFDGQYDYFKAGLDLKDKVNILQILKQEGINPDGQYYSSERITRVLQIATGVTPALDCTVDKFGKYQLYQVMFCVDKSGSEFMDCPVYPEPTCPSIIRFPPFRGSAAEGIYLRS
uniref:Uncharacterized protein n=1 Tax=Nelumbo nucifera TaxID=4432 RepID=A0A822YCW1_NELNU|nr:TPA_asm: hypothetical protein HUJ06_009158 [Nelumbo nucifera]